MIMYSFNSKKHACDYVYCRFPTRKNCLIKDLADLVVLILFLVDACKICKEHIRWICSRCNKSEDVTHKHRESVDDIII